MALEDQRRYLLLCKDIQCVLALCELPSGYATLSPKQQQSSASLTLVFDLSELLSGRVQFV